MPGRNLVVIVAGDFDPAAAKGSGVTEVFGEVPPGTAYTWVGGPPSVRGGEAGKVLLIDKADATQTYFMIGAAGHPPLRPRTGRRCNW